MNDIQETEETISRVFNIFNSEKSCNMYTGKISRDYNYVFLLILPRVI